MKVLSYVRLFLFPPPSKGKLTGQGAGKMFCFGSKLKSFVAQRLVLICKAGFKLCVGGGGMCGEEGSQPLGLAPRDPSTN